MTDRKTLEALLKRVEEAGGGSRDLDRDIWQAFDAAAAGAPHGEMPGTFYTSSIDAALALVERVLPGWTYALDNAGRTFHCELNSNTGRFLLQGDIERHASAPAAPLAILIAMLHALIAQTEPALTLTPS